MRWFSLALPLWMIVCFQPFPIHGAAVDQFSISIGATVENGIPGPGAGNIESPGFMDRYTLNAPAGQTLYFYDNDSAQDRMFWVLKDSTGRELFSDRLDGSSPGLRTLTNGGNYTVEVTSESNFTGAYSFKILNVPPPDRFQIPIGATVSDGVPGPGAGNIESPGVLDIFTFNATAGQQVYFFDNDSATDRIFWTLRDPTGRQLFVDRLDSTSPGVFTLTNGGVYQIEVGPEAHFLGTYSFKILNVPPPDRFQIPIGATVSDGVPGPGAGNIESPGVLDIYTFNATAGQQVYFFDNDSAADRIFWTLRDPTGRQLFVDRLDGTSPGVFTLTNGGVYQIEVGPEAHFLGTYSFKILNVPPPDRFQIPIGATVSDGVPGPGAGNIESPGVVDIYTFNATAGQQVYFFDNDSAADRIFWTLRDPIGRQLFVDRLDGTSPGVFTLTNGGVYQIEVSPEAHFFGTYSFKILNVPPPDRFQIPIGAGVSDGVPGPGAGNIESPGVLDIYTFNATAGQQVYFLDKDSAADRIFWTLRDPNGRQLFVDRLDAASPGVFTLTNGGMYLIEVGPEAHFFGNYSFDVLAIPPPGEFSLTVPGRVSTGIPAAGAGNLSSPGSEDFYRFTLAPGKQLFLEDLGSSNSRIFWRLLDANNTQIMTDRLDRNNPSVPALPPGDYTIVVFGESAFSGDYEFRIWDQFPGIATEPQDVNGSVGGSVTFRVEAHFVGPFSYQWFYNSQPITGQTNRTLGLNGLQLTDAGLYSVAVSNPAGSVMSRQARLVVQYGYFISGPEAERHALPGAPGDGATIDLYNGVGGGPAPSPADIASLIPSGRTLTPVIDFPHPGNTVGVGNSFDRFFADTTVPPEQVRALSAQNFILRIQFYLPVWASFDQHLETPAIDFQLGIGSDDGFHLTVGTNVVGSTSDRGFSYSWIPVSFEREGLYPVTLLYAANAVGQSGLELAWQTATSGGQVIIPQSALYISPTIGDRLITFEEFPPGTTASNQYVTHGVLFRTVTGRVEITTNGPNRFVPVSRPAVLGNPSPAAGTTDEVELTFTVPGTADPGSTSLVEFYLIDAESVGSTVTAYDLDGQQIFSQAYHGGAGVQERVRIDAPQIHSVRITLGNGADAAALDQLTFLTPVSANHYPQLAPVSNVTIDEQTLLAFQASATDREPGPLTFTLLPPVPAGAVIDPLTGAFRWTPSESQGPGTYPLTIRVTDNGPGSLSVDRTFTVTVREFNLPPSFSPIGNQTTLTGSTLAFTVQATDPDQPAQQITYSLEAGGLAGATIDPATGAFRWNVPANLAAGVYFFTVRALDNGAGAASATETFRVAVGRLADLAIETLALGVVRPFFGESILVNWTVQNVGLMAAANGWKDKLYLSRSRTLDPNQSASLADFPAYDQLPLAPGGRYSRSTSVELPRDRGFAAGTYFLLLKVDAEESQPEDNEGNNLQVVARLELAYPASAELEPGEFVTPATGLPGKTVDVTWTITNRGSVAATGPWLETILLSTNDLASGGVEIASFTSTNRLEPGASVTRSESVQLPATGPSGDLRLALLVDAGDAVPENNETNNLLRASSPINIPPGLTLFLPTRELTAGPDNAGLRIVVARNGSVAGPLVVTLNSSLRNKLSLPATVTIEAGRDSTEFIATAAPGTVADIPRPVSIIASAAGFNSASAVVILQNAIHPRLALALSTNVVAEGGTARVTLTRDSGTDPLVVSLESSEPARLRVPATIQFSANENTTTFDVGAVAGSVVSTQAVTVSALAPGYAAATATLNVTDTDQPLIDLALARSTISEGDGPFATSGTVTRSTPGTRSLTVFLRSSAVNRAVVPAEVVIPGGELSAAFPIGAVANTGTEGAQAVTITASLLDPGGSGSPNQGVSRVITVTDDDGPALSLQLDHPIVRPGETPAATLTVTRNQNPGAALRVLLVSDTSNLVNLPASLDIPANQTSASVALNTLAGPIIGPAQAVILEATAPGFAPASTRLVVAGEDLPDLSVSRLDAPASGLTDESFTFSYRVENLGIASSTNSFVQRIFISTNGFAGDGALVGQFAFNGAIPPRLFFEQSFQLRYPNQPGDYWLIVTADAANNVPELDEENNTAILARPIHVAPAYLPTVAATVKTGYTGTPIPLAGQALRPNGAPATFELVNIHIYSRGTHRILSALTDQTGRFTALFDSLPGEGGEYEVGAAHPGLANAPTQDRFSILGLRVSPEQTTVEVAAGGQASGQLIVTNLSDRALTGLKATVISNASGLTATVALSGTTFGPDATVALSYQLGVPAGLTAAQPVGIEVTSAEGARTTAILTPNIVRAGPGLRVSPAKILAGMKPGRQTVVSFAVTNSGTGPAGPLSLSFPDVPWLHLASTGTVSLLGPGEAADFTLLLTPPAELPLGAYEGTFVLTAPGLALSVPFEFRNLSDALAGLKITAVDEYTYYAAGSPKLTGAQVTVLDATTRATIASGVTSAQGEIVFPNLPEAFYSVEVRATNHSVFKTTVFAEAGKDNEVLAFLSRQVVKYTFTVHPTEIEDRTQITVETEFETFVPIPVVTVEPAVIDLRDLEGDENQITLKISNHGLIAANQMRVQFDPPAGYAVQPLIEEIGTLAARSSLTIPVLIRRLGSATSAQGPVRSSWQLSGAALATAGGDCHFGGGLVTWTLVCGPQTNRYSSPVVFVGGGNCPVSADSGGILILIPYGSLPSGTFNVPVYTSTPSECDPCLIGLGNCLLGFTPLGCPLGLLNCGVFPSFVECGLGILGCFPGAIGGTANGMACLKAVIECAQGGGGKTRLSAGSIRHTPVTTNPDLQEVLKYADRIQAYLDAIAAIMGDEAWVNPALGRAFTDWMAQFNAAVTPGSPEGIKISDTERAQLLAIPLPERINPAQVTKFIDRWNRTVDYAAAGIDELSQLAPGQNPDFMARDVIAPKLALAAEGFRHSLAEGYQDPVDGLRAAIEIAVAHAEAASAAGTRVVSGPQNASAKTAAGGGGICARVRLRIEQEAIISRDAFDAFLELENNGEKPLQKIRVQLTVRDRNNQVVNDRFIVQPQEIAGFTAIDGSGTLAAQSTGGAHWTIIPTDDAAPVGPTEFFVGGTLIYQEDDVEVTLPLAPASITVHPNASLEVKYFHQRDVFSDDPFTDQVEPSIPFSLAVMVRNSGPGPARNVRIASAQPVIVENKKGLLIDFDIIATEVAGRNLTPSLTANLGTIASGETATARWLLKSTLQGLFTDYKASFKHLDSLGEDRVSLIDHVEIHEMIHLVRASNGQLGLDFLVNDIPDLADLPDTLHLVDGRVEAVTAVIIPLLSSDGRTPGTPTFAFTAAPVEGWSYWRLPDPALAGQVLLKVLRSDGRELPVENFWRTDRTFVGHGRPPIHENLVHLFDQNSTGSYTLLYGSVPADIIPPQSGVTALPAESAGNIPLQWTGNDNTGGSGIRFFDIYVSSNSAPFQLWLDQTALTSAVYPGEPGRGYAFYSIARDAAGNIEPAPVAPDAQTSTTRSNSPPILGLLPDRVVEEGDTLVVRPIVVDPDLPANALSFALAPGAPAGIAIDPVTGVLTWATGESDGGTTNRVTLFVNDHGTPNLGASNSFNIVVRERNQPPVLQPLSNIVARAEVPVSFFAAAADPDFPANVLTFRLIGSIPPGAAIDPGTGFFSWVPAASQAPGTNQVTIQVADNGQPSLTDQMTFSILVREDVLSLKLDSTYLRSGETGKVSLTMGSSAAVTNISFVLELPADRLLNFDLRPVAGEISASLTPISSNRFRAVLTIPATGLLDGNRKIAELYFTADPKPLSAIVPIELREAEALRTSGTPLRQVLTQGGRIFLVAREPIVDAMMVDGRRGLVLYGHPGANYLIETSENLQAPIQWKPLFTLPATELRTVVPAINAPNATLFLRAREVP